MRSRNRRSPATRQILYGGTKFEKFKSRGGLEQSHGHHHRDIGRGGIHLAMGKEGNRALVLAVARVGMKQLMQRRRDRHGIEQQDKRGQQQGDNRPAASKSMTRNKLHNHRKLAEIILDASICLPAASSTAVAMSPPNSC